MRFVTLILLLAAVAGFSAAVGWYVAPAIQRQLPVTEAEPRIVVARGNLAADEAATIDLFETAQNSVAFITTVSQMRDPWNRRITEVPRGTGSGFVWDDRGHVVTNAHVIADASSAAVRLADGRSYDARLVGVDRSNDLAVLRIGARAEALDPLPIGTSDDLRVGQKVFAIGNPFGLDFTLTTGVVSALDRDLPGEAGLVISGLVQTDAAINPGNSGGPLLDSAGRLIGVNTAIYSPSGASAGIGFAVPVDTVNRVVPQLITRGRYDPPSLGITADPRADALLARSGRQGVLILGVEPGSPADAAGLQAARMGRDGQLIPGDVIVELDGAPVADIGALRGMLDDRRAGETVVVTLENAEGQREVTVELALAR